MSAQTLASLLLVSIDPFMRRTVHLKYFGAPFICLDSIEKAYRYLNLFKDADTIFIDCSLLTNDSARSFQTEVHRLKPNTKIIFLYSSIKQMYRLALPQNFSYSVLGSLK